MYILNCFFFILILKVLYSICTRGTQEIFLWSRKNTLWTDFRIVRLRKGGFYSDFLKSEKKISGTGMNQIKKKDREPHELAIWACLWFVCYLFVIC